MNRDQQLETEMAVISICCQHPERRLVAVDLLTDPDFVSEENRRLWALIRTTDRIGPVELVGHGASPQLADRIFNDWFGSPDALASYCGMMVEATRLRTLHQVCREVINGGATADEAIGQIVTTAQNLMSRAGSRSVRFKDAYDSAANLIATAKNRRMSGDTLGLTFGLPALDQVLGGIHGPRLVVLAALTGCGKTALLNQMAVRNAERGLPGAIFSLEMGADELVVRAMSMVGGVNVSRLMRGSANEDEINMAIDGITRLGDLPLWLDVDTYGLDQIVSQATVMKAQYGLQWIAIDHIGLVTGQKSESRNDWMGKVSRTLKETAKRLNIPVIALSQLNRGPAKDNRPPQLSDLRDSGNIEQDVDIAIMLHCSNDERTKPQRSIQIGVPKNRQGPAAWLDVPFMFDAPVQKFVELAYEA